MYIKKIEITDVQAIKMSGGYHAHVSMLGDGLQVQMHCAVETAPNIEPRKSKLALIQEAIRQLRRMPEYRTGRKKITFAPDVFINGATTP